MRRSKLRWVVANQLLQVEGLKNRVKFPELIIPYCNIQPKLKAQAGILGKIVVFFLAYIFFGMK